MFFDRLPAAFKTVAAHCGGLGRALSMSDAALAFEICDNDAAEAALKFVLFMDLRIANGSNGVVKASETFFCTVMLELGWRWSHIL